MTTRAKAARLSVTVDPELKARTNEIAQKNGTTTSQLVSDCLRQMIRDREEELLIEFYKTRSQEDQEFDRQFDEVVGQIVSTWKDGYDADNE